MKHCIFLLALPLFFNSLFAQAPVEQWHRTFDGAAGAFDEVKYIRLDSNQDVIVTGSSNGGNTMADVVTRKYDPSGNLLWSHTCNNSDYNRADEPFDMELTSNGNVVIVGRTRTSAGMQPNSIGFIYMLDGSNGTQVWLDTLKGPGFSGNNFSRLTKVVINASDEIFVTGQFTGAGSSGSGSFLMVAAKYNASGTQQWLQTFDHSTASFPENYGADISLDASGNVYVGGMTKLVTNGENFATWKINPSNGNLVWIATKPGPIDNVNTGAIRSIITDSNGNSYVYGIHSGEKHRVVKYDSQGSEQWSYDFDTIGSGFPASFTGADNHLAFDNSGNIILASLFHQMDFISKIGVAKFDQAGNLLWLTLISGTSNNHNEVYALVTDVNDNIYLTGTTSDTGFDIATIKLDPNGNEIWRVIKDGPASASDKGHSIALAQDGAIYVGGFITVAPPNNGDYILIKYQPTDLVNINHVAERKINMLAAPNPSNGFINLVFSNPTDVQHIEVFDLQGKLVYRESSFHENILNKNLSLGFLNSGIYTLKAVSKKEVFSTRLVLHGRE